MRWPLARQILTPMVGILLVTVALATALAAWLATLQVQARIEGQLHDIARVLSAANFPLESSVLKQASGLTGLELALVDLGGQPIAASDNRLASLAGAPAAREGTLDPSRSVAGPAGRYFHMVVAVDRQPVGGTRQTLHVFYPQEAWRAARWQATWPPLAAGGAAMLLVAGAAYFVAHRVTQPIAELRSHVARIAGGDFSPSPPAARDDEVRDLALAVNQMAERLAEYEAQARQQERLSTLGLLGGGIAHQIRNAATGCRLALDLHERDHGADIAPADESGAALKLANGNGNGAWSTSSPCTDDACALPHEPVEVARRQLELIESHIQRFLALGRPPPPLREPVDLASIVESGIALVQPSARHLGAKIEFAAPAGTLAVFSDRESLVQMVVNLLTNAVQATAGSLAVAGRSAIASDAAVTVRLEQATGGPARIEIGDPGPGPSPAIADRLFEPFATDKPGGTGLGLVVARRIAEDHGGTIRWLRSGERTWFIIELPLHETETD
jgi:signal transduction histidine kinase